MGDMRESNNAQKQEPAADQAQLPAGAIAPGIWRHGNRGKLLYD